MSMTTASLVQAETAVLRVAQAQDQEATDCLGECSPGCEKWCLVDDYSPEREETNPRSEQPLHGSLAVGRDATSHSVVSADPID